MVFDPGAAARATAGNIQNAFQAQRASGQPGPTAGVLPPAIQQMRGNVQAGLNRILPPAMQNMRAPAAGLMPPAAGPPPVATSAPAAAPPPQQIMTPPPPPGGDAAPPVRPAEPMVAPSGMAPPRAMG